MEESLEVEEEEESLEEELVRSCPLLLKLIVPLLLEALIAELL